MDVFAVFRRAGIGVFRRRLSNSNISGLLLKHETARRCILVNYDEDPFRQRFSVVHEVGHVLLDDEEDRLITLRSWSQDDLSEVRANRFASNFLLPPEFLQRLPDPESWTDDEAVDWAVRLRVNAQTLSIALSKAELISRDQAARISRLPVPRARKEDPELPPDLSASSRERRQKLLRHGLPVAYVSLCLDALGDGFISAGRLAEVLLIGPGDLDDVFVAYGGTR